MRSKTMKWFFQKFQDTSYAAQSMFISNLVFGHVNWSAPPWCTELLQDTAAGLGPSAQRQFHIVVFKIYHKTPKNSTSHRRPRSGLLQDEDTYQAVWPHCFIAANLPPRGPAFHEGFKRNTDVCVDVPHQGELPDQCQRNRFLKEK